ncbi:Not1 N-terminal domain, CCR4-Not complex component-domain-containing protein [Jimgerdemannia flammicorona]|uniref:General negative regulator of transcription subunit n=1 Tax=Jimgerdemannia flammicorona TaxID=994334 RepID=A0A433CXV7_9FUNG|nr:Not1 N-terminal domain, CCR4-Not complex component-domain-containing protein [Jimgerdemannia flammicorona]
MANRKLQTEIDRILKKVTEGVETFEGIFEKIQTTQMVNQKEKLEQDLKKEIKKLQRHRDQIKTWISSNEIKDKRALLDNRKLIESQMEKFKACEKEMKTKAYSKEGLSQSQKMDPKEKEKLETCDWVSNTVDELSRQMETAEAEVETLQGVVKKGRKDTAKAERLSQLEHMIDRHKWHTNRLELVLRLLENGQILTDKVVAIKDDVNYYVENNQDPEYEEYEMIYQDLNLEEEEELYGLANDDHQSDSEADENDVGVSASSSSSTRTAAESQSLPRTSQKELSVTVLKKDEEDGSIAAAKRAKDMEEAASPTAPRATLTKIQTSPNPQRKGSIVSEKDEATSPTSSKPISPVYAKAAASNIFRATPLATTVPAVPSVPTVTKTSPVQPPATTSPAVRYAQAAAVAGIATLNGQEGNAVPALPTPSSSSSSTAPVTPDEAKQDLATTVAEQPSEPIKDAVDRVPLPAQLQPPESNVAVSYPTTTASAGVAPSPPVELMASLSIESQNTQFRGSPQPQPQPQLQPQPSVSPLQPSSPIPQQQLSAPQSPVALPSQSSLHSRLPSASQSFQVPPSRPQSQTPTPLFGAINELSKEDTIPEPPENRFPPSLSDLVSSFESVKDKGEYNNIASCESNIMSVCANKTKEKFKLLTMLVFSRPALFSILPFVCQPCLMLDASFVNVPDAFDSERSVDSQVYLTYPAGLNLHLISRLLFDRPFVQAQILSATYYPQHPQQPPTATFDNPALFEKFDIDALFFIFYYQQGTYQQYLAARELKKQSWRFHKKYLTWFQRHEEPKIITDEYEQGTYIYFDYEGAWCQRKKTEFRFEYRFLEDADLM